MAQPYELEALKNELRQFTHDMLTPHVVGEYESRITEWKKYFNLLVDAQKLATEEFSNLLQQEHARYVQAKSADNFFFGLGVLALSIAAGPLASFVGGMIEHVWFPRFASTIKERVIRINSTRREGWWNLRTVQEQHWNQVHAKIFGDLGGQVTGLGIDGAIKVITPDSSKAKSAVLTAKSSSNLTSFRTNLENSLLGQAQVTKDTIEGLAFEIRTSPDFGEKCLEKVTRTYHGHVNPARSERATLENLAKKMICDDLDRIRQEWANKWFFYGYDPPKTSVEEMRDAMEIELWASWILDEQFKLNREDRASMSMDPKSTYDPTLDRKKYNPFGIVAAGKSFPYLTEPILERLAKFGIVEARSFSQKLAEMQRQLEEKQKEEAEPPSRDVAEINQRSAKRWLERQEELKQRPRIQVGAKVDSVAEIRDLEAWARNHPPKLGAGRLSGIRRTLDPMETLYRRRGGRGGGK